MSFSPYHYMLVCLILKHIDWELKVDAEFDKYDLSKLQVLFAVASALTKDALSEWKYICRHNKVLESWKDFK